MKATQGVIEANIVDLFARRIDAGRVRFEDGRITAIETLGPERSNLPYLMPGFVDAHVHIESSMLVPSEFARPAMAHGTVAVVSDPHEIANVLGLEGIDYMLESARETPLVIDFGAPSCVPATPFETAGAALGAPEITRLFEEHKAGYLSEVMNYPGVLAGDPELEAKLAAAKRHGVVIDGHAPGLRGEEARAYADHGIRTDHECTSIEEAEDKIAAGMSILIREGSAARNFDALRPLIDRYPDRVMFCSDDKHPDDLSRAHIGELVKRAIALGHDRFNVLRAASLNPVLHYSLPVGLLRVSDFMDAILVDDLVEFRVSRVFIRGRLVAENGRCLIPPSPKKRINVFRAAPLSKEQLMLPYRSSPVRVIEAYDGQLVTGELACAPTVVDGHIVPDPSRDLLLMVVVNRYVSAPPALALVKGFGLCRGAIASSVAHDSHNIIAVGADIDALCRVLNAVIDKKGGLAAAFDDELELLPLPIAGLMSDEPFERVAEQYQKLDQRAKELGSKLRAPFMTLSFMALLVIPALKLSDKGLFDGRRFRFIPLEVDQGVDRVSE